MRVIAWILVAVVIAIAALLGYSMYAAELTLGASGCKVVAASDMAEQFAQLQQDVADQALKGVAFVNEPVGEIGEYSFHLYTVAVANRGFLAADWVELNVTAGEGDILQVTPQQVSMLPGLKEGQVTCTVLARADASTARDLTLTYFVFGRPYKLALKAQ